MRLIRLSTDDNNAVFDTTFNTSISIKPGSQMALQSFFTKIKNEEIIAFDEVVTYNFDNVELVNVPLRSRIYDRNNYEDLLDDIVFKLTKSWGTNIFGSGNQYNFFNIGDNWKLGRQWYAYVDNSKINIDFKIAQNTYDIEGDYAFSRDVGLQNLAPPAIQQDYIFFNDGITDFTSELKFNVRSFYPLASNSGYVRIRIGALEHDANNNDPNAPIDNEGFLLGLTATQKTNADNSTLLPEDIKFGIGVGYSQADGEFRIYVVDDTDRPFISDQVPQITSTIPARNVDTNSYVEIRLQGSQIFFEYSTADEEVIEIRTINLADEEIAKPYYPFIVLHSDVVNMQLTSWDWTFDPVAHPASNYEINTDAFSRDLDYDFMARPNIFYDFNAEFTFRSLDFARFLGFNQTIITQNNVLQEPPRGFNSVSIIGDNIFKAGRQKLNLLLEILNQNINSYDSEKKSRFNIISTLLSTDANFVVDDVPSIVFLDLLNKDEIDFRNIKIRLLDENFELVKVDGKATMTLLIKSPEEI